MICIECDSEVSDKARFCGNCGAKFSLVPDFIQKRKDEFKEKQEKKRLEKEEKKRLEKERHERIERELQERLERKQKEKVESERLEKENQEKERKQKEKEEAKTVKKLIKNLDNTDYTLLESQRTENILLSLHIGLEKQMNSIEKLIRCKLVKKLDREPTFTEKEKLERQRDTPQYKQHVARLNRIMDKKMAERLKEFCKKIGLKTPDDPFELTHEGEQILAKKRKVLESVWQKLTSAYDSKNKQLFREEASKRVSMFPLFMIMGFANGAMMGTMMGSMGMNPATYMQDMDMAYNDGYADGSGDFGGEGGDFGGEGGDFGGDGGGFMDGGMSVGM